ncbi:hypothetical protein AB0D73_33950 [Streptomyces sp. NPDC048215]|uniref:hypothetical protein n=1 Tax=Streptomyces sp. NPDC048215 TaxID=3156690 RepID=UPI003404CA45
MGPRHARIAFTVSAAKELKELSKNAVHALDSSLVAISVDPKIGDPPHGTGSQPFSALRQYADEIKDVRVLYFITALRTVVVVAYIEV